MNNRTCTLEYIAKEIDRAIENDKIDQDVRATRKKCLSCTSESRCNYYMPLIRVQNIIPGRMLYGKGYKKETDVLQIGYENYERSKEDE